MRTRLILMALLLVLGGCSDENSRAKGEFLSGCVQSGAPKAVCICTYEKLEQKYSPQDLISMERRYHTPPDSLLQEVREAAKACRQQ